MRTRLGGKDPDIVSFHLGRFYERARNLEHHPQKREIIATALAEFDKHPVFEAWPAPRQPPLVLREPQPVSSSKAKSPKPEIEKAPPKEQVRTSPTVHRARTPIPPEPEELAPLIARLPKRQRELLGLVSKYDEQPTKEVIAQLSGMKPSSAAATLSLVYQTLGLTSRRGEGVRPTRHEAIRRFTLVKQAYLLGETPTT